MTEQPRQVMDATGSQADGGDVVTSGTNLFAEYPETVRTFVLSTAKNGHVNLCIALADLIGADVEQVIQVPGSNKSLPKWGKQVGKMRWLLPALRMLWRCRQGKFLVLASGRSVLFAGQLLKRFRGDDVFIVYVGSPRTWTKRSTDVMLRANYEREPDLDEDNRYPWKPKQVWVDAPICRPLPVLVSDQGSVAVLLGGLNTTYGDEAPDYVGFLDMLEVLIAEHPVSIVFSRRTKPGVKEEIERRFGHTAATLVDAADRQGFLAACERAGAFVVTPDSITMVAESCATGKPVYMADLPVKLRDTSNYRFIETSLAQGHVQLFDGTINFERRAVDRADVEAARHDITSYINSWMRPGT